ncbi:MAG TPA: LpqB family beta-propeller domain-containing protein [Rugosimonospora sp.]|nr:LpqB family beta-propeller domain-containing protein [Rugosimonospora sp.]
MADRAGLPERPARHLSRRTVLRALLLGAGGAGAVAACGVPSRSGPHIVSDGPTVGSLSGNVAGITPPSPKNITDAQDFVRTFLRAAASRPDDDTRRAAVAIAKSFLTSAAASQWQPDGKQITVVRVLNVGTPSVTATGSSVTVDLVTVGLLGANGAVTPAPASASVSARFELVRHLDDQNTTDDDQGIFWRIDEPLPAPLVNNSLLLSGEGLTELYASQLIYFWASPNGANAKSGGLVPDLRYLPRVDLPFDQQPTTIVNWLIDGPADWLAAAVTPLANGPTNLVLPHIVQDQATRVWPVNFTSLQDVDPDRVAAQVHWSLQPAFTDPVQVKIGSQDKAYDGKGFFTFNLCDNPPRDDAAVGYFVVNGQVRQADQPYAPPSVFAAVTEPNAVAAAMSRDGRFGALVRQEHNGRYRLVIGQVQTSGSDRSPVFQDTQLTAGHMTRPVWLPGHPGQLLVVADNALHSVNSGGQNSPVTFSSGFSGPVAAFAVAPDGYRIALISGGRVAVAPLAFAADAVTVGTPTFIDAGGLAECSAVAWSRPHWLVVAGRSDSTYPLVEVSVDGAVSGQLYSTSFDARVTQLVCYPPLPSQSLTRAGPIMVQTQNNHAYRVSSSGTEPLAYAPPSPAPSPSTPPSGGTPPINGKDVPVAPFYLD